MLTKKKPEDPLDFLFSNFLWGFYDPPVGLLSMPSANTYPQKWVVLPPPILGHTKLTLLFLYLKFSQEQ